MRMKVISVNRKAYHDYFIYETWEAGLVLTGSEIKSIRDGRVNLRDSYVTIKDDEAWLIGAHISLTHKQTAKITILDEIASSCYTAGRSIGCAAKYRKRDLPSFPCASI